MVWKVYIELMNLGFIGTGEITKAVVIGILKSKIKYKKIYISKRNKKISNFLKIQNKNIKVLLLLLLLCTMAVRELRHTSFDESKHCL